MAAPLSLPLLSPQNTNGQRAGLRSCLHAWTVTEAALTCCHARTEPGGGPLLRHSECTPAWPRCTLPLWSLQVPKNPRGTVFFVHGCVHSGYNYFPQVRCGGCGGWLLASPAVLMWVTNGGRT